MLGSGKTNGLGYCPAHLNSTSGKGFSGQVQTGDSRLDKVKLGFLNAGLSIICKAEGMAGSLLQTHLSRNPLLRAAWRTGSTLLGDSWTNPLAPLSTGWLSQLRGL